METEAHPSDSRAPVFIVGSPRSGTTLLYHMLLSSGGFAVYRTESHVFDVLAPYFGRPRRPEHWEGVMKVWRESRFCRRTGVDPARLIRRVVEEADDWGDFQRVIMDEVCQDQEVARWADCTPQHVLHLDEIARSIPEARFVHIIRDGRDVAVSMERLGWIRPIPVFGGSPLEAAAAYWAWTVRRGRRSGRRLKGRYMEVRFEDLVNHPELTLAQVGSFIEQDLDWTNILDNAIGSVRRPNSSFTEEGSDFNPIGRWRRLGQQDIERLNALGGKTLNGLGYDRVQVAPPWQPARIRKWIYDGYFALKHWVKHQTPLGRFLVRPLFGEPTGKVDLLAPGESEHITPPMD